MHKAGGFQYDSGLLHACTLRRTVLIMLLTVAAGGTVCLENPANSLIALHDRFIWFVKLLSSHGIRVPQTQLVKKCGLDYIYVHYTHIHIQDFLSGVMWLLLKIGHRCTRRASTCASSSHGPGRELGYGRLRSTSSS